MLYVVCDNYAFYLYLDVSINVLPYKNIIKKLT